MQPTNIADRFSNIIPKEISGEAKLSRWLSVKTFIILVSSGYIVTQFARIVHPKLLLPYYIFGLALSVVIVLPSSKNPGKLLCQSLYLSLFKDSTVYHPIDMEI